MRYIVSACLMGANCKYNGGNNYQRRLSAYLKNHTFRCVCPEVLGGLPTPRLSVEIQNGRMINTANEDVSEAFEKGAAEALKITVDFQPDAVILQSRSPSCGVNKRYSGNFDGKLIAGSGIFAQALMDSGYKVYDIEEFLAQTKELTDCE